MPDDSHRRCPRSVGELVCSCVVIVDGRPCHEPSEPVENRATPQVRRGPPHPRPPQAPARAAPARSVPLSPLERDFLDFERWIVPAYCHKPGAYEQAVRDLFDLPTDRYLQLLHHLLDRREALDHAPMTVLRLQRIRAKRKRFTAA